MWDQNPLLHKLTIDDLARDFLSVADRSKRNDILGRLSGIAIALTAVLVTVSVIGANTV